MTLGYNLIYFLKIFFLFRKPINQILIFLLGASIGSFLGVLADRLPKGEDIVLGRSYCDHCRKKLSPSDLIPLLSFIFLLGRCRFCRKAISFKYPLVELATGLGFVFIFHNLPSFSLPSPFFVSLIFLLFIFSCLVVIFVSDWQYLLILDVVLVPAVVVVFLYRIIFTPQLVSSYFLSGLGASLFLLILHLVTSGRGMGFGDVKLAFLIGLFLGFPAVLLVFYIAFLTGAFVGIILLLSGKIRFKKPVPFGPFLVFATFIVFLWKDYLLTLFLKLLP